MQNMYLTTEEVAEILRIQRRTVQLKIRKKELRAVNLGTEERPNYRVTQAALDAYLEARAA